MRITALVPACNPTPRLVELMRELRAEDGAEPHPLYVHKPPGRRDAGRGRRHRRLTSVSGGATIQAGNPKHETRRDCAPGRLVQHVKGKGGDRW